MTILLLSLYLLEFGRIFAQTNGDLRLTDNGMIDRDYNEGRLQVYINGQWGNVCDDNFDITAATTTCRQLGYESATDFTTHANDSFGTDNRPALLSLNCNDDDLLHIFQCDYNMSASCDASEEIAIYCSNERIWDDTYEGQVRLQDGSFPSQGRVEVYSSGTWRTLCESTFGDSEANTVCRQLGYTGASSRNSLDLESSRASTSDYECCYSAQSCFTSCYCRDDDDDDDFDNNNNNDFSDDFEKRATFCFGGDDATVQCEFDVDDASNAGRLDDCDFTTVRTIVGIVLGTVFGFIFLVIMSVAVVLLIRYFCTH